MKNKNKNTIIEEAKEWLGDLLYENGVHQRETDAAEKELAGFFRKYNKEVTEESIAKFCKEKTVITNFECGEHGKQVPLPTCPKCEMENEK